MTAGGAGPWRDAYGQIEIWAAFRCDCGGLAAMADQISNGNAAMVHTTPRCQRFEDIPDQRSALKYFRSIQVLPLTPELAAQIDRETVSA